MKPNRFTSEHFLFALAVLIGLSLRLINLGKAPLSDFEAKWALQALSAARGEALAIGSQTGYVMLSGLLFWLFNSSNLLARLLPALAGSALILAPLFFRSRLGRTPALILAFGLALDPGLVSLSRLAGSSMLAAGCLVLGAGFAYRRHPILAGVFAGLALLSGPSVWMGLLGIGLALLILRWQRQNPNFTDSIDDLLKPETPLWQPDLKKGLVALLVTIFMVGSLFFRYPQGLGAWLLSIPEFFKGFVTPSGIPALRLLIGVLVYQPLAVIFALICLGHFLIIPYQDHLSKPLVFGLLLWLVFALLAPMIDRGRRMEDLVWVLLPLWALASLELAYLFLPGENKTVTFGHAALTFILLCVVWLVIAAITQYSGGIPDTLQIAQLVGSVALLIVAAYLITVGWGWEASRPGLAWGSAAFLGVYILSAAWGVSQYSAGGKLFTRQELWYPAPLTGNADLLASALDDLSLWHTNHRNAVDVRLAVDAPSMVWLLRDYPNLKTAPVQTPVLDLENLPPDELPSIIITYSLDRDLNLSAAYRGQDFAWQVFPAWEGAAPPSFLSWLVHRQAPQESYQVILWARADLFPGGLLTPETTGETIP